MQHKILIAEDDTDISRLLSRILEAQGYQALQAFSGTEALSLIEREEPDLLLLDLMLPGLSGEELLRKLREERRYSFPVLVLSAKSALGDKVALLKSGADDYITKPFNPLEVAARVKTQLRRYMRYNQLTLSPSAKGSEYDIRGLVINKETHKCSLYDRELSLTPIEFSLLWYLCERQGVVVPSEELFENVWGEKYLSNNNTVMAHIGRLREKMNEPAKNPKFIKTVWGVGYTIEK